MQNIGTIPVGTLLSFPDDFGVDLGFDGGRAVVAVVGELDSATVPTLRAMLDGLVDGGHHRIVLDLDDVTFMGAAGLGVMVHTLVRLRPAGGSLVLRSVSHRIMRLLEITGLDASIEVEIGHPDVTLRIDLARAATQPARDRAVDAQLSMVVALAEAMIDGADGVSVTLRRGEVLATVAATNATVLLMDAHQYSTGEGPCLSAADVGETFLIDSLAGETRWPSFVPLASGEGIGSIRSTPLIVDGRPIGALNIYSNRQRALGESEHLAGLLADQASRVLATAAVVEMSDEEMGTRIAAALRSRLVLAQAQGVLMGRDGITADDASDALHQMARTAGTSVLEHAMTLVASTQLDVGSVEQLGSG